MNVYINNYLNMRKTINTILFMLIACHATLNAQKAEPVDGEGCRLKGYTTSWIGNDGGYEEAHIPHDMLNMFVTPEGVAVTICGWDEGGTNVGVFRDGRLLSRPEGSGTGGWGRFSGAAVVADDKYVYQLLSQNGCDGANNDKNVNGLPQYPPCRDDAEWKTVRRYDLLTGLAAPFKGGYGYKGDMLVVCAGKKRQTAGLAIDRQRIYVAVCGEEGSTMTDSIKVYDRRTMTFSHAYALNGRAGHICTDARGGLWMMQGRRIVRMRAEDGRPLGLNIELAEDVEATSFSIDLRRGRLLVANHGRDMNILIYSDIYRKPTLSSTFGTRGGVFSTADGLMKGEAGPLRFSGPRAVGTDNGGRIYVANTTVSNGRGATIEAYDEDKATMLWKREGLIFTATADFDRTDHALMFSPEKIHRANFSAEGGRLDRLTAYTADPFTFPDDVRVMKDGPFITSVFRRSFGGSDFLFVSDMYGGMLAGYRFDREKHGYVGIPCLLMQNGDCDRNVKLTWWTDLNGDGRRQDGEQQGTDEVNTYSMSFFVDEAGNVWRGTRQHGFMMWRMEGLDPNGVPRYAAPRRFRLPEGFTDAKRIHYDAATDVLYLAGFSQAAPDSRDTWWAMGSTIAVCPDFIKNHASADDRPWKPGRLIYLPFCVEDGSGGDHTNAKAFTVAGDYIFVALAREGWITVYDRHNGRFVGRLQPGESVHGQSGWCDFNYAINAIRQADGSYLILHEENAFGKILCYRWKP